MQKSRSQKKSNKRGNKITDEEIYIFSVHEISTYKSSRGQCQKKSNKRKERARISHGNANSLVQLKQVMTLAMNHIGIESL